MGALDASDLAFIEKFENCGFQKACWNHEAHVRMAWIQLSRSASFGEALERIRGGIMRFNASVSGVGYHETVTVAYTHVIHFRMLQGLPEQTWGEFFSLNADLIERQPPFLGRYYSRDLVTSEKAKGEFIQPDKKLLPILGNVRLAQGNDAAAILRIYAPFIKSTAVSFEICVPSEEEMKLRIESYLEHAPWLVYESAGKLLGYAYASKHRAREAYQWTVEVSAYVDGDYRNRGIARVLYSRLFSELKRMNFCLALAGITLPNEASVQFHSALGFVPVGVYRDVGFKFNSWHDVAWYQRRLKSGPPDEPPTD